MEVAGHGVLAGRGERDVVEDHAVAAAFHLQLPHVPRAAERVHTAAQHQQRARLGHLLHPREGAGCVGRVAARDRDGVLVERVGLGVDLHEQRLAVAAVLADRARVVAAVGHPAEAVEEQVLVVVTQPVAEADLGEGLLVGHLVHHGDARVDAPAAGDEIVVHQPVERQPVEPVEVLGRPGRAGGLVPVAEPGEAHDEDLVGRLPELLVEQPLRAAARLEQRGPAEDLPRVVALERPHVLGAEVDEPAAVVDAHRRVVGVQARQTAGDVGRPRLLQRRLQEVPVAVQPPLVVETVAVGLEHGVDHRAEVGAVGLDVGGQIAAQRAVALDVAAEGVSTEDAGILVAREDAVAGGAVRRQVPLVHRHLPRQEGHHHLAVPALGLGQVRRARHLLPRAEPDLDVVVLVVDRLPVGFDPVQVVVQRVHRPAGEARERG
ncbi:MAG: hypothetical protein HYU66_07350 [Armatimonadetes bacterium]|nr:hypothetical protein [Armatimonadota bacterium]